MKKVLFVFRLILVLMLLAVSCNSRDEKNEPAPVEPSLVVATFTDIPVDAFQEGSKTKISFILSHKFYVLENTEGNKKYMDLLKNAIEKEHLLKVTIKNKNEIIKIEDISKEDTDKFALAFSKPQAIGNAHLEKVLPNEETLNKLFDEIKSQTCSFTRSYPCISFNYPEDGCYARAHKVRQFLANKGYDSEKMFIYGNLSIRFGSTHPDKGGCCVNWSYHVAVLVSYKDSEGNIQKRILDPSVFSSPLKDSDWQKLCLNDSCGEVSLSSSAITGSDVYARSPKGKVLYDPNYKNTDCILEIFSHVEGCYLPVPSTRSCGF